MIDVFLGGTCNNSKWRDEVEAALDKTNITYFNPVVENWTIADMDSEIKHRQNCKVCLYTITPKMIGVYSIAEVIDDSNKRPMQTVLCLLEKDGDSKFAKKQWRSLERCGVMVEDNGGRTFYNLKDTISSIITNI